MLTKGFTLIETVIILLIISVLFCIIPLSNNAISFNSEVKKAKEFLLNSKYQSMSSGIKQTININHHRFKNNNDDLILNSFIDCGNHDLTFNARGNANMAQTITCSYLNKHKEIVINLGSGFIYDK